LDITNKGERHCPGLIANCKAGFSSAGLNCGSASAVRFLFYFFLFIFFIYLGFQVPLFSNIYDSYVSFDNPLGTSVNSFNPLLAFHLGTVLNDFSYQNVYGTSAGASSPPPPPINHLPVAYPGVAHTTRDTPVFITLSANDQDGDPLTFFPSLLSTKTAHGKLGALTDYSTSSSLTTARIAYFPDRGYIGSDSFSYQAADTNNAASNVATIYLIIR
jgi:hypothetical protein